MAPSWHQYCCCKKQVISTAFISLGVIGTGYPLIYQYTYDTGQNITAWPNPNIQAYCLVKDKIPIVLHDDYGTALWVPEFYCIDADAGYKTVAVEYNPYYQEWTVEYLTSNSNFRPSCASVGVRGVRYVGDYNTRNWYMHWLRCRNGSWDTMTRPDSAHYCRRVCASQTDATCAWSLLDSGGYGVSDVGYELYSGSFFVIGPPVGGTDTDISLLSTGDLYYSYIIDSGSYKYLYLGKYTSSTGATTTRLCATFNAYIVYKLLTDRQDKIWLFYQKANELYAAYGDFDTLNIDDATLIFSAGQYGQYDSISGFDAAIDCNDMPIISVVRYSVSLSANYLHIVHYVNNWIVSDGVGAGTHSLVSMCTHPLRVTV